jgi:hypothetical protein
METFPSSSAPASEAQPPVYIGAAEHELIELELAAWDAGYRQAVAQGAEARRDLAAIQELARAACEDALQVYVPLDLSAFCRTYSRGWAMGYYAAVCGHTWQRAH